MFNYKNLFNIFTITIILSSLGLAESKRMAFVEKFTAANCGACRGFSPTYKSTHDKFLNDVIPVSIAVSFSSGGNGAMHEHHPNNGQRVGLYVQGSFGIPAVFGNGDQLNLSQYSSEVSKLVSTEMSPITIYPIENREEAGKLKMRVLIQSDENLTNGERLTLFIVEGHVNDPDAGKIGYEDFYWITRDIFPSGNGGMTLNLEAGDVYTYEVEVDVHPEWDMSDISLVAIVQDPESKEVLQAARTWKDNSTFYPDMVLDITAIDFGDQAEFATERFTIKNDGLGDLKITEMYLADSTVTEFMIENPGTSTLKPGKSSQIVINFNPTENGEYAQNLILRTNDENNSEIVIPITAKTTGIVPFGDINFASTEVSFETTSTSSVGMYEISNKGTGALTITNFIIDEDSNTGKAFSLKNEFTEDIVLQIGDTYIFELEFTPINNIEYRSYLIIESDSKNNAKLMVDLIGSGEGIEEMSGLTLIINGESTDEINLGNVSGDDPTTTQFELKNSGNVELNVINMLIVSNGDDDTYSQFTLDGETNFVLEGGDREEIDITLTPNGNTEYNGILKIITQGSLGILDFNLKANAEPSSVDDYLEVAGILIINISSNPITSTGKISFNFTGDSVEKLNIDMYDINGKLVSNLFNNSITNGERTVSVNAENYISGTYYLSFEMMGHAIVKQLIINK